MEGEWACDDAAGPGLGRQSARRRGHGAADPCRPTDPVAIGCPLGDDWPDGPADLAVVNARDRAHDIVEYLAHAEVARSIGDRVTVWEGEPWKEPAGGRVWQNSATSRVTWQGVPPGAGVGTVRRVPVREERHSSRGRTGMRGEIRGKVRLVLLAVSGHGRTVLGVR
ncbi:hypothetical protein [Streptomyces pseudogriseolus]|uniref:hypothetical protein n=1 Tax=Streptomyces pseudogriseolus TaxID=36817 RepID=UPI003FA2FFFD